LHQAQSAAAAAEARAAAAEAAAAAAEKAAAKAKAAPATGRAPRAGSKKAAAAAAAAEEQQAALVAAQDELAKVQQAARSDIRSLQMELVGRRSLCLCRMHPCLLSCSSTLASAARPFGLWLAGLGCTPALAPQPRFQTQPKQTA
jgi:hypothetical protein